MKKRYAISAAEFAATLSALRLRPNLRALVQVLPSRDSVAFAWLAAQYFERAGLQTVLMRFSGTAATATRPSDDLLLALRQHMGVVREDYVPLSAAAIAANERLASDDALLCVDADTLRTAARHLLYRANAHIAGLVVAATVTDARVRTLNALTHDLSQFSAHGSALHLARLRSLPRLRVLQTQLFSRDRLLATYEHARLKFPDLHTPYVKLATDRWAIAALQRATAPNLLNLPGQIMRLHDHLTVHTRTLALQVFHVLHNFCDTTLSQHVYLALTPAMVASPVLVLAVLRGIVAWFLHSDSPSGVARLMPFLRSLWSKQFDASMNQAVSNLRIGVVDTPSHPSMPPSARMLCIYRSATFYSGLILPIKPNIAGQNFMWGNLWIRPPLSGSDDADPGSPSEDNKSEPRKDSPPPVVCSIASVHPKLLPTTVYQALSHLKRSERIATPVIMLGNHFIAAPTLRVWTRDAKRYVDAVVPAPHPSADALAYYGLDAAFPTLHPPSIANDAFRPPEIDLPAFENLQHGPFDLLSTLDGPAGPPWASSPPPPSVLDDER